MSSPTHSDELISEIKGIIIQSVNLHHLDATQIGSETSLRDGGLELDSIDLLEVVLAIEQRFGVKIDDAEMGKKHFRTIGSIAELVQQRAGTS